MILRRLAQSIRRQDWFTVVLEIVIVVLGVFIGIEVANWNEARTQRAQERAILAQLRDEIAKNDRFLAYQIEYYTVGVEAGRRALAYLEGGEDCVRECELLLIDFFHASQIWGAGYMTYQYREADRLGFPSDPNLRATVRSFHGFIEGWDAVNMTPPAYRERVRGHFPPAISAALWGDCYVIVDDTLEVLSTDCRVALETLDITPTLRSIRADTELASDLRYWLGQNIFALQEYPLARRLAGDAIAGLTNEVGDRP